MKITNLPLSALLLAFICIIAPACFENNSAPDTAVSGDESADAGQQAQDVQKPPLKEGEEVCDPGEHIADAELPAMYDEIEGKAILVNGQTITPAGQSVVLQEFPWGLAVSPDGKHAYVTTAKGSQYLQVVDLTANTVIQTISDLRYGHGIAVSSDGTKVYAAGASDEKLHFYDRNAETGLLTLNAEQGFVQLPNYAGGLAISPDGSMALVTHGMASKLSFVNLETGELIDSIKVGYYPYDVIIDGEGAYAYVSNWGGDSVSVVDIANLTELKRIKVGKNPEGMALANGGADLIVTNSDTDDLTIIDTATQEAISTLPLTEEMEGLVGWTPNAVAVHPTAALAYVASTDRNAIEVVDTENWEIIGAIPTAKYPTRVTLSADGEKMYVLNSKGWSIYQGEVGSCVSGSLQILDVPANETELADLTTLVENNVKRPLGFYPDSDCEDRVPLPTREGQKSVIEHVILIIKENKTYDEVLGDLVPDSEWHDPELCLFGEAVEHPTLGPLSITPNAHKLSRQFIDFVNYYADAEKSVQGHMWVTKADCNDFLEKVMFDGTPMPGVDPNQKGEGPSIFEHIVNNGLTFRNYGEVVNFFVGELKEWAGMIDTKYPFWSMAVRDTNKAKEIIREWELAEYNEILFPPFVFIILPNDHTYGHEAGTPTPASMVADNDEGLGMLVDWVSHSEYWEKTLMIIIEDDPQSAVGDHIDAHRSLMYVASPWVKRAYTSKVHYSIPSVYRTIELILGLPPMNKNTALATPMYDIFQSEPNLDPYDTEARQWPEEFNPEKKDGEESREKIKGYDGHAGLGDEIWKSMKGDQPRPPQAKRIDE